MSGSETTTSTCIGCGSLLPDYLATAKEQDMGAPLGLLLVVSGLVPVPSPLEISCQRAVQQRPWAWNSERANLLDSMQQFNDYEVEILCRKSPSCGAFKSGMLHSRLRFQGEKAAVENQPGSAPCRSHAYMVCVW
jgi:hypothetical protein